MNTIVTSQLSPKQRHSRNNQPDGTTCSSLKQVYHCFSSLQHLPLLTAPLPGISVTLSIPPPKQWMPVVNTRLFLAQEKHSLMTSRLHCLGSVQFMSWSNVPLIFHCIPRHGIAGMCLNIQEKLKYILLHMVVVHGMMDNRLICHCCTNYA